MRQRFLTVAVAILLVGVGFTSTPKAAPAPKLTDTEKDQAELQRTWYCESFERDTGKYKPLPTTLTFENDRFTLKQGKMIVWEGTYTIDVSKDPKTIDVTVTVSQIGAEDLYKGKVVLGVYKLDKGTLKLCVFDPACQRPNPKFPPRGRPGLLPTVDGDYLYTFKKDKP